VKYYIKYHGQNVEDAIDVNGYDVDNDYYLAAVVAAEDFWTKGGWECTWPITFTIIIGDAEKDVEVEMEMIPNFSALAGKETK
jgi:hypothetical protein